MEKFLVQKDGKVVEWTEAKLRRVLRAGDLSGVELARPPGEDRGRPLHELALFREDVGAQLRAGMTTADIDARVRADTLARGARPSQLGYNGFPAAVCTSVNEVVCHGIPGARELADGDIVNVDVTSETGGFHGDTSITFEIGTPPPDRARVLAAARACLDVGIAVVRPGARLGDIAAAIMTEAARHECTVVKEFCGHGIGRHMHMAPQVSHVGRAGTGLRLQPGMCFTIEPMTTLGDPRIVVAEDGWTAVTTDGSPSAQFEHTVLVTPDGCEVLTRPFDQAFTQPGGR